MDPISQVSRQGFDRYHFALRRLHSLTGGIVVGGFLIEHMLTNFSVVVHGPAEYTRDVGLIQSIPWLRLVEWAFIFLPLAFHGAYGLFITVTGQSNVLRYPYSGNIRYTLQRITAIIAFIFVVVHLGKFRFNYLLPNGVHFTTANAFDLTAGRLANPIVVGFYVIGIVSVVFHFANGIWTGLITWGVTLGSRSQWRAGWICAAVGVVLGVLGLLSLFWFSHYGRMIGVH